MDRKGRIKAYLEKHYEGIFLPEQIQAHIDNYIEEAQTDYLIEKIRPLIKNNSKILDIGSGYGSFTLAALKNGFDCKGIELAEFDHAISKERALEENLDPNIFIRGSALQLPFLDESFDVVTFWNVLEHVTDYRSALREAERVVRPGGKIFIIAPNYLAFRNEAHYQLPWLPLFPKPLASIYLRLLKRNPSFLRDSIFYITVSGLCNYLKVRNFQITTDLTEKLDINYEFQSSKVKLLVGTFKKYGALGLLKRIIFILRLQPFVNSIDIIAVKPLPAKN